MFIQVCAKGAGLEVGEQAETQEGRTGRRTARWRADRKHENLEAPKAANSNASAYWDGRENVNKVHQIESDSTTSCRRRHSETMQGNCMSSTGRDTGSSEQTNERRKTCSDETRPDKITDRSGVEGHAKRGERRKLPQDIIGTCQLQGNNQDKLCRASSSYLFDEADFAAYKVNLDRLRK